MLLTTHYMEEAAQLCDRLVVMDHGRIIAEGTPASLIAAHVGRDVIEIATGDDPVIEIATGDDPAARDRALALCRPLGGRVEPVGDHVILYLDATRDPRDALAALAGEPLIHRRATLEDVFLTLTGRELRE
jgi:lipooligosaccharide transport system ATP-binding protein